MDRDVAGVVTGISGRRSGARGAPTSEHAPPAWKRQTDVWDERSSTTSTCPAVLGDLGTSPTATDGDHDRRVTAGRASSGASVVNARSSKAEPTGRGRRPRTLGFVREDDQRTELVRCEGDTVWVVVGPDLATLGAIVTGG
jgi:hypothetical protein